MAYLHILTIFVNRNDFRILNILSDHVMILFFPILVLLW